MLVANYVEEVYAVAGSQRFRILAVVASGRMRCTLQGFRARPSRPCEEVEGDRHWRAQRGLEGLQVYNIPTLNDDVLDFMVPVPSVLLFLLTTDLRDDSLRLDAFGLYKRTLAVFLKSPS